MAFAAERILAFDQAVFALPSSSAEERIGAVGAAAAAVDNHGRIASNQASLFALYSVP